jgi:hypothetical protein
MSMYLYTCKCGHKVVEVGQFANTCSTSSCPACKGLAFGLRDKMRIPTALGLCWKDTVKSIDNTPFELYEEIGQLLSRM